MPRGDALSDLLPHPYGALPEALPDGQLEQEDRESLGKQHDPVRNQEGTWNIGRLVFFFYMYTMQINSDFSFCTASIFLGQIRESPDVAQPDRVADGGQDERQLGVPRLAHLGPLLLRWGRELEVVYYLSISFSDLKSREIVTRLHAHVPVRLC